MHRAVRDGHAVTPECEIQRKSVTPLPGGWLQLKLSDSRIWKLATRYETRGIPWRSSG